MLSYLQGSTRTEISMAVHQCAEIALSITEAEYIILSLEMCRIMPVMALMSKVYLIFDINIPNPEVFRKVFEDNQIFIPVAESNKTSPRTKNIAIKYQNFRSFVQKKMIRICYIDTWKETADIFTKPLDEAFLIYIRRK